VLTGEGISGGEGSANREGDQGKGVLTGKGIRGGEGSANRGGGSVEREGEQPTFAPI